MLPFLFLLSNPRATSNDRINDHTHDIKLAPATPEQSLVHSEEEELLGIH